MADRYHRKLDELKDGVESMKYMAVLGFTGMVFLLFVSWQAWSEAERAAEYAEALCKEVGGMTCDRELVWNRRHPTGK